MEILEQERYSEQTINAVIATGLEDSITIEFKSADALSKTSSVKKEISKNV